MRLMIFIVLSLLAGFAIGYYFQDIGRKAERAELEKMTAQRDSIAGVIRPLLVRVDTIIVEVEKSRNFISKASHKQLDSVHAEIIAKKPPITLEDSVKCMDYGEYRDLLSDAAVLPLKDSIIGTQGVVISALKSDSELANQIIELQKTELILCEKSNQRGKIWRKIKDIALLVIPVAALAVGYLLNQK